MSDLLDKSIEILASRDSIRKSLVDYCKEYLDLTEVDLSKSSYLSYLINVLSVLSSNLVFYNSSVYREFFLTKARQKESVINLASMLGYTPRLAVASSVNVTVMITLADLMGISGVIEIPGLGNPTKQPFTLTSGNDIVFTSKNTVKVEVFFDSNNSFTSANITAYDSNNISRDIPWSLATVGDNESTVLMFEIEMIQKEEVFETFYIPPLEPYQFYVYSKDLDPDTYISDVKIYSGGTEEQFNEKGITNTMREWIYTPSLFLITSEEYSFSYRINEKEVKIIFGNGIIGKQPTPKEFFVAKFGITKGFNGCVIGGAINKIEDLLKVNLDGSEIDVPATFINLEPSIGGLDYPTIEEIRRGAIAKVSSNRRLVTHWDYSNIKDIVPELPILDSLPVLKRSDLKCNEVCLYTNLIYNDQIVPTRNEVVLIKDKNTENTGETIRIKRYTPISVSAKNDSTSNVFLESALGRNNIKTEDSTISCNRENIYDIDKDQLEKYNMVTAFDMILDERNKSCKYYYTVHNISTVPLLKESDQNVITIRPNKIEFVTEEDDNVTITLNCSVIDYLILSYLPSNDIYNPLLGGIECQIKCTGIEDVYYLYLDTSDLINNETGDFNNIKFTNKDATAISNSYKATHPLLKRKAMEFDDGNLTFTITLNLYDDSQNIISFSTWEANVLLKKDLSDFMISPVEKVFCLNICDNDIKLYRIYDVPVLSKDFIDNLKDSTKNGVNEIELFEENIYQKLVNFDPNSIRMLTDFVNLKFSNTFGIYTSMLYNKERNIGSINYIDPDVVHIDTTTKKLNIDECLTDGSLVAITNFEKGKYWNSSGISDRRTGYVMKYKTNGNTSEWLGPYELRTNDILLYDNREVNYKTKLIFNGHKLTTLVEDIPLQVVVDVWIDSVGKTNETIIETIKNSILNKLSPNFGYTPNISVSDIEMATMSVSFVKKCVVIKPTHDIFLNFKVEKLLQTDVLRYTPELLYVTYDSIVVNIRMD